MGVFKGSRIFVGLVAIGVMAVGSEAIAQGKGRGQGHPGRQAERGNRGGGQARGHVRPPQQVQQQAHPQNRGNDRRAMMQQRMQQIQQQGSQQAQQLRVPQNRGIDRGALMQQRMQQAQQQRVQQSRGVDRGALMRQRMQQIQQQRMQQAQQPRIPLNRGVDRGAEMRQRMQQIQQQRMQQAQQRIVPQNRGAGRGALMQQRMQQAQQRIVPQSRGIDRGAMMHQRMQEIQRRRTQFDRSRNEQARGADRRNWNRDRQTLVQPQIIPQPKTRNWFGRGDHANRLREFGGDRLGGRHSGSVTQSQLLSSDGVWPRNYGQQRRADVHRRNAERRSWRDGNRRSWYSTTNPFWGRTYTPTYRPATFFDNYIYAARYMDNDTYRRSYWRDRGDRYDTRRYDTSSYDVGYIEPYYYGDYERPSASDIIRNVIFAVLGGGIPYYDSDANYAANSGSYYGYAPQYAGYQSYGDPGYSYATDPYYYDPYFYEDPYFAEVLPIQYFVADEPGTGMFRQMFTHLLAIGYEQGYLDGVAAKRVRERDRVFYDPYTYENASFDPYSVSLGDNRRCLSEGYELGYQDALDEIDGFDQFQDGGVDLVSVLIGTVSQLI